MYATVELVVLYVLGVAVLHAMKSNPSWLYSLANEIQRGGAHAVVDVTIYSASDAADLIAKTRGYLQSLWLADAPVRLYTVNDATMCYGIYASEWQARYMQVVKWGRGTTVDAVLFYNPREAQGFIASWAMRHIDSCVVPTAYYPATNAENPVWVFIDTDGLREFVEVDEFEARDEIVREWENHYPGRVYQDEAFRYSLYALRVREGDAETA